jgi:sugar/nucleoside kinase (ribokinase family)
VGIKLGHAGSLFFDGQNILTVPAIPCKKPVDTTGAGDAFMAGFVRGMLLGEPLLRCAQMGSAMGYYAIQSLGATTHQCTLETVLTLADQQSEQKRGL